MFLGSLASWPVNFAANMEASIGSRVRRGVRSCWMGRRSYYQRLPASRRPAGRGVRLGRLAVLASTSARRFGRLRRAETRRWSSTLRLLHRIVDAYVGSLLSRPLRILRAGVPPGADKEESLPVPPSASPPTKPRREASASTSPAGSRRHGGGRGVMLNICVAEALLLRRSTSEVRRSPLQRPREAGRCAGARAQSSFQ